MNVPVPAVPGGGGGTGVGGVCVWGGGGEWNAVTAEHLFPNGKLGKKFRPPGGGDIDSRIHVCLRTTRVASPTRIEIDGQRSLLITKGNPTSSRGCYQAAPTERLVHNACQQHQVHLRETVSLNQALSKVQDTGVGSYSTQ
jgi:hypothetical protein